MFKRLASRAASTLILAEHNADGLNAATLSTVSAAAAIGGDVSVLVASDATQAAAEAASKVAGVSKVIVAEGAGLKGQLPEAVTPVMREVIQNTAEISFLVPRSSC